MRENLRRLRENLKHKIRPLVTSHPDDECMFFGPTILSLTKNPAVSLFLLCMSNGDYRREGRTRKGELYQACKVLGIQEDNITVLR